MAKSMYSWDDSYRSPGISAETAAIAIARIEKKKQQERITPKELVEAARPENSPLHAAFEWNDSVAGERYRIIQARQMIRALVIETPARNKSDSPIKTKAYINVVTADGERSYMPTSTVVVQKDGKEFVIAQAKKQILTISRNIEHLTDHDKELRDLCAMVRAWKEANG